MKIKDACFKIGTIILSLIFLPLLIIFYTATFLAQRIICRISRCAEERNKPIPPCPKGFREQKRPTLKEVAQSIKNAWLVEGRYPPYHRQMQERLREEWPTLYYAIQQLLSYEN